MNYVKQQLLWIVPPTRTSFLFSPFNTPP